MSLKDEINDLRRNREVEQEARLAKEREEAQAQIAPEAIARKLIELRVAKLESEEGVSQLLAVNAPALISEVAVYLQQRDFSSINLDKRRIEERDVPTVEIEDWVGEGQDGWRSFVRVRCKQERRERPLRIGSFSDIGDGPTKGYSTGIQVETQIIQGSLKMYVSGVGRDISTGKEPKELKEQSLRELIVAVLADFKV